MFSIALSRSRMYSRLTQDPVFVSMFLTHAGSSVCVNAFVSEDPVFVSMFLCLCQCFCLCLCQCLFVSMFLSVFVSVFLSVFLSMCKLVPGITINVMGDSNIGAILIFITNFTLSLSLSHTNKANTCGHVYL